MLSDEERVILDFERFSWVDGGPKDALIEFELGLPASDYYERLLALIAKPAAVRSDPLTVKRVSRLIEAADVTRTGAAG